MKENLIKALFIGIAVSIGIALVMLVNGEKISIFAIIIYGLVAFIVDYICSLIFNKNKK